MSELEEKQEELIKAEQTVCHVNMESLEGGYLLARITRLKREIEVLSSSQECREGLKYFWQEVRNNE